MSEDASVGTLVLDPNKNQFILVKNIEHQKDLSSGENFRKPGGWGLPTGRGQPDDQTLFDTAQRETAEETGGLLVEIDRDPKLKVEKPARNHIRVAFVGYPVAGKIGIPADKWVEEARWFPIRVLWIEDPADKDYVNIYPVHRWMAQELLRRHRELQKQKLKRT